MEKYIFPLLLSLCLTAFGQVVPLPEHPNPIKYRTNWENLNGDWHFAFDSLDVGQSEEWFLHDDEEFDKTITVPFPWGSQLSGVSDDADIGWYKRSIQVNRSWEGERVFLIVGASDWETSVWLNGHYLGQHQGGYVPFEFDVTRHLKYGEKLNLVIKVDDARRPHTLYGKQGYGNARGIWQTVYLETRGDVYVKDLHVSPDIDKAQVEVTAYIDRPLDKDTVVTITVNESVAAIQRAIRVYKGQTKAKTVIEIPDQKLWTLDDPHLYEIKAQYGNDELQSYFGMRKIGVVKLPNTDISYIALNNQPIYLQMALDQSYHPEGFYTFPSEQFIIDEIKRSKSIGLNGIRTHIKVEVPRKLYWADRLGLLVMEDLPNSWGEPEELMQNESTYTLREMIKRDYNHPSIFSWVIINETWGMLTRTPEGRKYLPETQKWLESMYHLAKSLDPTRLVEDNSICCGKGHTVTDINSWHVYLPGYQWDQYLDSLSENTFKGSGFNYETGYAQGDEPNFNSECGNVWGYEGSAGDVDWSWDYHRMMNSFRTHPKIGGWLYTEHHDVINEWNGYWRYDRSEKYTGLEDIVPGMTIRDFHSPIYLSTGQDISYTKQSGELLKIPLFLSSMSDQAYEEGLVIEYEVEHITEVGEKVRKYMHGNMDVTYVPWMQQRLDSLEIELPEDNGLSTVKLQLKTKAGDILHRNFVHVIIEGGSTGAGDMMVMTQKPSAYSASSWSTKTWDAMEGKKVNGAGTGYFEYTFPVDQDLLRGASEVYFLIELSAKELFVKDMQDYQQNQDFMKGSRVAPSSNPNSYPMTDQSTFSSNIRVTANGQVVTHAILPDDPADHRGVLSWHSQLEDRKLREAGSYGYYIKTAFNEEIIETMKADGQLVIRFESIDNGGIAVYGKDFGRYPFDPSLVIK